MLKHKTTIVLTLIFITIVILVVYLFGKPYFQRKSFENERDKNRTERCISREENNCSSKRKICKLNDKKGNEKCQSEFDECVKEAFLRCGNETW